MKKIVAMLICVLLLTGCMNNKGDTLKSFKDYNSKMDTYELSGNMKIISNEDEFTYDLKVGVLDNKYYKVTLTNTINNHEQIILKNDSGVFVVTPNLNKSFKFMSEWPDNSSQAYLLGNLVNDINKDNNAKVTETAEGYVIDAKVNYPNNAKFDHETITTDKDFNVKKVEVKDNTEKVLLSVDVKDIKASSKFDKDYFNMDLIVEDKENNKNETTKPNKTDTTKPETTKPIEECMSTCKSDDEECKKACKSEETANILDEIIYPLYVPSDTYLSSKDTVNTENGNRVILTFAGVDPFILVEEVSRQNDEMEIIPVSGEPLLLGGGIAALSNNSLYWCSGGVDFYLTSNTLDGSEMMTIAESITNGSSLVASTK